MHDGGGGGGGGGSGGDGGGGDAGLCTIWARFSVCANDGMQVTLYYDPMVSKLIVWGPTREDAIKGTLAALERYHIAGISTTIPFCSYVLKSEAFRSGRFSTNFVKEHWVEPRQEIPAELLDLAAAAAVRAHARIEARISGEE